MNKNYQVKWCQLAGTPIPNIVQWLGYKFVVLAHSEITSRTFLGEQIEECSMNVKLINGPIDPLFVESIKSGRVSVGP